MHVNHRTWYKFLRDLSFISRRVIQTALSNIFVMVVPVKKEGLSMNQIKLVDLP